MDWIKLESELEFTTSRSSGPGGQNVNKVNSKVTVKFDVRNSAAVNDEEKSLLEAKLRSRITADGLLILSSQDRRSQLDNKLAVIEKLKSVVEKALQRKKSRKPSKPTKASAEKRIEKKKQRSEKKKWRKNLF